MNNDLIDVIMQLTLERKKDGVEKQVTTFLYTTTQPFFPELWLSFDS